MTDAELLGARKIRELLDAHRIMLTKSLGQNFVVDPNTIRKVVDIAGITADDHVLEIGAGAGSLTLELARRARRVTALEIDERLKPVLHETLAGVPNVSLVYGDVLALDLSTIDAAKVVANLPYNIAAQTVIRILQEAPQVSTICVMTQREVGERLASGPGSKTYGLTSVLVGFYADASVVARISRNVFFPAPKVDSVLVAIHRREDVARDVERAYLEIARAAFGQRRKNIRNSLTAASIGDVDEILRASSISPDVRPETLDVNDFIALARASR
ncbi:MAG: 16S rRNA (adenine(1518)-N(6)/adenine(1519)-N(6))-dimethyltransferase RsmA [Actinobacteria bacterium]|nr:16S rRNA (adenine(1518)-N(6)/adenine(1519)-N(6))-dimethyltransferase RsmA [Actinomycetota bacterium]